MIFDKDNAEISRVDTESSDQLNFKPVERAEFPGPCKGICKNYKAIKPLFIGRYAANQVRCQIFQIFLTSEGTELKNGSPGNMQGFTPGRKLNKSKSIYKRKKEYSESIKDEDIKKDILQGNQVTIHQYQ